MAATVWADCLIVGLMVALILYLAYTTLLYKFDAVSIAALDDKTLEKLRNAKTQALLNGSGINNIPGLDIRTTNPAIAIANSCADGPVYYGPEDATNADCVRLCANASATVLHVTDEDRSSYVFESAVLRAGSHCRIGPRPECNMKTSYALMTVNSVTCRSKFPRLVGGPTGTTIVACNDQSIQDPQNILWDYKSNVKFNPFTTTALDEDERLPDGSFRFRCRYGGVDDRRNLYQEHPTDRLHPVRNYCAGEIFAAHPAVRTVFSADGKTFTCDCGNVQDTRVEHMYPDDPSSVCIHASYKITHDVRQRFIMRVPYRCFTMFSRITDAGKYLPCPADLFTRNGSMWGSVSVPFTTVDHEPIEHPMYGQLEGQVRVYWKDTV